MQPDRERLHQEFERLRDNSARRTKDRGFELAARWNRDETAIEYLYRQGQLICDERDLDTVLEAFDQLRLDRPEVTEGPVGLAVLHVPDTDAAEIAAKLAEVLGDERLVAPNHVLDAQVHVAMCPATEPVPAYGPIPVLGEPVGPGRPRVAVVDTGYFPEAGIDSGFSRFSAVKKYEIDDDVYVPGTDEIRPYGGHGTATTARLLAVSGAEGVEVEVRDCLLGGAVDELAIVEDLEKVIKGGANVVSVQAGLYARPGNTPKSFDLLYRRVVSKHPDTVIVAAAGNHGTDVPFWPAAYSWVTAIGALTTGGDYRAPWSNFGYWVDAYTPGESTVIPYPNGRYDYIDETSARFSNGHAIWSGTSFAAPVVAGLIARRMIEREVSAPVARHLVLQEAAIGALHHTGPRLIV
ncbi:S8/S53 family peptidase [Jiangella sp. DSM 45060]|uniref:S8/S53 family peptidase n=1 Tax=Jiangella sp. DSM 45060 TaxID=1798224 RepID=UPI00087C33D7|nr:S8/S53 family peptidase [Jiangella sp. DSM 45060]SDT63285.1 Subtilase family protein [Jiangella sp. DSM 45060]